MMKQNFESPAHTSRQIRDRNITLYMSPGAYAWKVFLNQSDSPEIREIGRDIIVRDRAK